MALGAQGSYTCTVFGERSTLHSRAAPEEVQDKGTEKAHLPGIIQSYSSPVAGAALGRRGTTASNRAVCAVQCPRLPGWIEIGADAGRRGRRLPSPPRPRLIGAQETLSAAWPTAYGLRRVVRSSLPP